MPLVEWLPDDLKELAYRNAIELPHARWKSDVQVLIRALRTLFGEPLASASEEVKKPGKPGEEPRPAQRSAREDGFAAVSAAIDAQTMERIKREAAYIGPIANVVVKRAAGRCVSMRDLCDVVAREIKSEAGRVRFLASCKPLAV